MPTSRSRYWLLFLNSTILIRRKLCSPKSEVFLKMAAAAPNGIEEILKPFYQRASEAEDRLAKLEASVARNNESGSNEQLKVVGELQSQLERAKAEQLAEREQAMKEVQRLATENAKLEYRIAHLVRAVEEVRGRMAAK